MSRSVTRRRCLQLMPGRCRRRSGRRAAVCGPAARAALSAGVSARRLRRHQRADPVFQQFLLRGAPDHRHRAARPRKPAAVRWRSMPTGRWRRRCATRSAPCISSARSLFVPFAGTQDLSRSHFETQDSIELGQPLGGTRDYRSGFLARLHPHCRRGSDEVPAIAFTDALPLAFQGPDAIPTSR